MTPFLGVCFLYRGASPRNSTVCVASRTEFVERRRKRRIRVTVFYLHFNFFSMRVSSVCSTRKGWLGIRREKQVVVKVIALHSHGQDVYPVKQITNKHL